MQLPRFGIKARIYGGTGVLVAFGVALAAFGGWQLSTINDRVTSMRALSDSNTRVLQLVQNLETIRRAMLRYKTIGDQTALNDGDAAAAAAAKLVGDALGGGLSVEQRKTYQEIETGLAEAEKMRDELAAAVGRLEASRGKLFRGGDEMTANTAKLVEQGQELGDADIAMMVSGVDSAVLLVGVTTWRFLATADPKGPATFKDNVAKAVAAIAVLEAVPLPDQVKAAVGAVKQSLGAYSANFAAVSGDQLGINKLFDEGLQPRIVALSNAARQIQSALGHDFAATEVATADEIAGTILMQKIIAGLALLIGAAIAYVVGRSIVHPVAGMTVAMTELAQGHTEVEIPSRDATDEIGAMAKAVDVFKANAIERARLETEQEAERQRAAAEKRAALQAMADKIESAVNTALEEVGSRTAAMAGTAGEMSGSATRTGDIARDAAVAAGQALANIQTVASAAEELTSSIHEIGRQVEQSNAVVKRAVGAGNETKATMQALNEQVTRIGAVADMIGEIAARTNLLALNATIEAARAGDAGKGFAVVASEVKQLATQTARSTEQISRHIGEVSAATSASVAAVGRIEQTIGEISAIAGSIAAAVEQQGAATAEIARNVTETAAAAGQMSKRTTEVSSEAEQTGRHATAVRDNTGALNNAVTELKRSVVRAVRTSTAEVDRRHAQRRAVDLPCRLEVAGKGSHAARLVDLSEGGAAVSGAPDVPAGSGGTAHVNGIGFPLPFTVRGTVDGVLHVSFNLDESGKAKLRPVLDRMEVRRAA